MAKLDQICQLNMGQSPDSSSYNETGNGMPFFQGNADFGKVHPKTRVWCSAPTKIARAGDVLISVRAPIGALNIADRDCCIGRGLAALTVKEEICNKNYLWYAIASKVDELNSKGTGSTFKAISKSVLAETEIPLPSLEEQQSMAGQLAKVDELIALRKEQLVKLDRLVKSRFIELFGDPATNPMGWAETTVGEECYYIKDGPHKSLPDVGKGNGYPFISVRNIVNGYIDFSTAKYISEQDYLDSIKKCHPQKGDMLYSKGGTTGIAKLIDVDIEFANWVHVAVLKFSDSLNGVFFEKMLNSDYCYDQSQKLTKGVANRDLVLSAMAKIRIYKPPIELQEQFAAFVEQTDKSKLAIQQSLDKLELLKKSLMQEYFG